MHTINMTNSQTSLKMKKEHTNRIKHAAMITGSLVVFPLSSLLINLSLLIKGINDILKGLFNL